MPDSHFKPLPWTRLKRGVPCYLPKAAVGARVSADSPALAVMTDFRRFAPVTIARDAALDEASRLMTLCGVHYLLVGDEQRQLRRSTVHGITPTGVDGRPSRAIKPEPVAA